MKIAVVSWLAIGSLGPLALSACGPGANDGRYADLPRFCQSDSDCDGVCNRVGECAQPEDLASVRVRWTVNGLAPSPQQPDICRDIPSFRLSLDPDYRDRPGLSYTPIPCNLGQVFYDRLPQYINRIRLRANSDDPNQSTQSAYFSGDSLEQEFLFDFSSP